MSMSARHGLVQDNEAEQNFHTKGVHGAYRHASGGAPQPDLNMPIEGISDEDIAKDIKNLQDLQRMVDNGAYSESNPRNLLKHGGGDKGGFNPYADIQFATANREINELSKKLLDSSYPNPDTFYDKARLYQAENPDFKPKSEKLSREWPLTKSSSGNNPHQIEDAFAEKDIQLEKKDHVLHDSENTVAAHDSIDNMAELDAPNIPHTASRPLITPDFHEGSPHIGMEDLERKEESIMSPVEEPKTMKNHDSPDIRAGQPVVRRKSNQNIFQDPAAEKARSRGDLWPQFNERKRVFDTYGNELKTGSKNLKGETEEEERYGPREDDMAEEIASLEQEDEDVKDLISKIPADPNFHREHGEKESGKSKSGKPTFLKKKMKHWKHKTRMKEKGHHRKLVKGHQGPAYKVPEAGKPESTSDVDESLLMAKMLRADRRNHDNATLVDLVDQGHDSVNLNITHSTWEKKIHGHRDIIIMGCVVAGVGIILILVAIVNLLLNRKRQGKGPNVNNNRKKYKKLGKPEETVRLRRENYSLFPSSSEDDDDSDDTLFMYEPGT